jgi:hypothetical protein
MITRRFTTAKSQRRSKIFAKVRSSFFSLSFGYVSESANC